MRCPEELAIGALVVNALEPDERLQLQLHIAGCADCRTTHRELADLTRALDLVTPKDLTAMARRPAPSELAYQRLRQVAARQPRRRAHRRLLIAAAALVIAAGGVAVAVGLEQAEREASTSTVSASEGTVDARVVLTSTESGTRITLVLNGVAPGERCQLVAVGRDGEEEVASTWTATYAGAASVTGNVQLERSEVDQLIIRTLDGRTLVTLDAGQPG